MVNDHAELLMNTDMNSFWSGIRKSNNSRLPLAATVNQWTGEINIAEMWQDHVLNCIHNSRCKENFNEQIAKIGTDLIKLTINNNSDALKSLKRAKRWAWIV